MSAELTRKSLEESVRDAWNRQFSPAANTAVDRKMAAVAVADVVSALRANPAWCKSLGLGRAGEDGR